MTYPLFSYSMVGQLTTPPYQTVNWIVYGAPDLTGAQSGYAGQLQNISVASQQQITTPTNPLLVNAQAIQGTAVIPYPPPTAGQTLIATVQPDSSIQYQPGSGGLSAGNATQLQGVAISSTAPTTNYVLQFNGTSWVPTALAAPPVTAPSVSYTPFAPGNWFSQPTTVQQGLDYIASGTCPATGATCICDPTVGASSGNIFKTFAAAIAYCQVYGGANTTILVKTNTTVTTAVNLSGIALVGPANLVTPVTLTFGTGSSITGLWSDVRDLVISCTSTSGSPLYTMTNGQVVSVGRNARVASPSTAPMFGVATGAQAICNLFGPLAALGDDINPIFVGQGSAGTAIIGIFVGPFCAKSANTTTSTTTIIASVPSSLPIGAETLATTVAYSVQSPFARVVTPNAISIFSASFSPGAGGALLAVVDITPRANGHLIVNANFFITGTAETEPEIALFYVDNLTAITGGTAIATGITAVPTSTTPAYSGGTEIAAANGVLSSGANATLTMAGIPVQAVANHRTLLAFFAVSPNSHAWTNVTGAISVTEGT